jgi:hypothetical protein
LGRPGRAGYVPVVLAALTWAVSVLAAPHRTG